jgi:hypothetical protein
MVYLGPLFKINGMASSIFNVIHRLDGNNNLFINLIKLESKVFIIIKLK